MNYMKQVAEMLGVELDEEFKIEESRASSRFKLTLNGGYRYGEEDEIWQESSVICDILNGNMNIVKLPKSILSETEKEYLSYVIKPFRNSVKYIYKFTCANGDYEAIAAKIEAYGYCDGLSFPKFKKGSMYKGMELVKEYSLEELDI